MDSSGVGIQLPPFGSLWVPAADAWTYQARATDSPRGPRALRTRRCSPWRAGTRRAGLSRRGGPAAASAARGPRSRSSAAHQRSVVGGHRGLTLPDGDGVAVAASRSLARLRRWYRASARAPPPSRGRSWAPRPVGASTVQARAGHTGVTTASRRRPAAANGARRGRRTDARLRGAPPSLTRGSP